MKPTGVCDYYTIIVNADLDLETGLEIIPVDKRIDYRFSQSFDRWKGSRTQWKGETVMMKETKAGASAAKHNAPATTHRIQSNTVGADHFVVQED